MAKEEVPSQDERGPWCLGEFGMKSELQSPALTVGRALRAWVLRQLRQGAVWSPRSLCL